MDYLGRKRRKGRAIMKTGSTDTLANSNARNSLFYLHDRLSGSMVPLNVRLTFQNINHAKCSAQVADPERLA